MGKKSVSEKLLGIITQQTGYPLDAFFLTNDHQFIAKLQCQVG